MKNLFENVKKIIFETGKFLREAEISSIEQKEGHANFVTDLDIKVQEKLVAALSPLLPEASFILEETDEKAALTYDTWIIDPIDGTQNFIKHCRMSAISIALVRNGEGLFGIVYNPFTEELFTAIKNQGAFLNGKPIRVSGKPLENSIIGFGTALYYENVREKFIPAIKSLYSVCGDFRRSGSAALDLCYTACGRYDGFFEFKLCPWDYAAGSIIVKEAGGLIDAIGTDAFHYIKPIGIVAGTPELFWELKHTLDAL